MMNEEIDYICHDCQQPVYKMPKNDGYFYAGHRCRTPEQIAEDEEKSRKFRAEFGVLKIKTEYVQIPLEQKKLKD